MTIGEKIKARRIELGMTQQELADKMGYTSRSSICVIETGKENNLTEERIGEFAKALQMSPMELFDREEKPDFVLRDDEMELIIEWRSADVQTREMVKRVLSYKEKMLGPGHRKVVAKAARLKRKEGVS
jgi:transcriptional regulator with XRE-family HTH domain